MKYYKSKKELPGHPIGDTLIQANDFYMWETIPYYSLTNEIVENFPDWFERLYIEYQEGEEIWYISLNGIIVSDTFERLKHSTLIDFGNIFRSEEEAKTANTIIKKILQKED